MASGDIALKMLITGNAGSALSALASVGMAAGGLKGVMATVAVAGVAAVAGLAVASVKMAGDFQGAMERLVTSAGESQGALKMVGDGILKISVDTGTSTDQLTAAMYKVESSGSHGAEGLKILTAAAQGAKTENADLSTVTQALIGVMKNYSMPATDATKAMDGLIATVKNGDTTLQAMSAAMAQVLPTAASLGISFAQVGGAMDTMVSKQMPAEQAAQNLAHVLVALSAPSGVAVKSMKAVGLSAQEVKDALANQGLPQALQMIEDHVGAKFPASSVEYTTALKNIMGGLVGYKLAAQLTGASLKDTQANIDAITAAMKTSGGAVDGFAQIQGTLNFQLDRVKESLNALMITIGQALLPVVTTVTKGFADFVGGLTSFASTGAGITVIVVALSAAFAGLLVLVGGALKSAFTGAIASLLGTAAATATETAASDASAKSAAELAVALKMVAVSSASMAMASGVTTTDLVAASAAYDAAAASATADAVATTAATPPTIALGAALWTALAPILPIVLAIAALVAGFIALYKNCEPFRAAIDGLVTGLKQFWNIIVQQIQPALKQLGDTVGLELHNQWVNLVAVWQSQVLPALQQLGEALKPLLPILEDLAVGAFAILIAAIYALVVVLKVVIVIITDVVKIISDDLYAAIRIVTGGFQILAGTLSAVFDLITGQWSKLKDDLGTIGKGVENVFGGIADFTKAQFSDLINMFGDVGGALASSLGPPLQSFWASFTQWVSDAMDQSRKAFDMGWTNIATDTGGFFSMIGTSINNWMGMNQKAFDMGWNNITSRTGDFFSGLGSLVKSGIDLTTKAFSMGMQNIGSWFTWLYNHNHYIRDLCNFMKDEFHNAIGTFEYSFQSFGDFWTKFWTGLATNAGKANSNLGTVLHDGAQKAIQPLQYSWQSLGSWWPQFWDGINTNAGKANDNLANTLQNGVQKAIQPLEYSWQSFGDFFQKFWGSQAQTVQFGIRSMADEIGQGWQTLSQGFEQLLSGITQWVTDLNNRFAQWGLNLIKSFADGFASGFNYLNDNFKKAAQMAYNLLGFSSPTKEGPGHTSDQWMPNLVNMLSRGLIQGIPQIQSASGRLAGGISSAFAVRGGAFALPGAAGSSSNQPGTMNVTLMLDSRVLAKQTGIQQAREVRIQGGYKHA